MRWGRRRRWIPLSAAIILVVVIGVVRSSRETDRRAEDDIVARPARARPVRPVPPTVPSLPDPERRERLREQLRRDLGDEYDVALPAASDEERGRGAYLWARLCAGCHGGDARSRRALSQVLPVPPGDLTDPERAAFYSDRARLWILSEGSEGTPMFGWKDILSESDRHAVLAHLQLLMRGS